MQVKTTLNWNYFSNERTQYLKLSEKIDEKKKRKFESSNNAKIDWIWVMMIASN